MARTKARENYGMGSVNPVMVNKTDKDGNVVMGDNGKPTKVQKRDRKTGKPVWRICIFLGYYNELDKEGNPVKKQRKVQKTAYGTLKEARAFCKELSKEYAQVDFDSARGSFSSLVDKWNKEGKHRCSSKQQAQNLRFLGYIAPLLDVKPLIEIKKADIETAIKSVVSNRNLSVTSRNKILSLARRVFEFGIDADYLSRNPCRGIDAEETGGFNQRVALTEKQAAVLRVRLDETEESLYAGFMSK